MIKKMFISLMAYSLFVSSLAFGAVPTAALRFDTNVRTIGMTSSQEA